MRSVRELYSVSVRTEFKPEDADFYLYHFKINFDCLYEEFEVNETLKTHVILEHFSYYFKNNGTNFRITNGEFFEAAHYSKKKHEVDHGYVVKKKQGTKHHLLKSLQSLSSYNSIRIGSTPPRDLTLRKRRTPSPSPSTPTKKGWNFPKVLLDKYNSSLPNVPE